MEWKYWPIIGHFSILLLGVLLLVGFIRYEGSAAGPTPTASPTPLPTVVLSCQQANDAIQDAVSDYHNNTGKWPTSDGGPGDILWTKLVPNYMDSVPSIDSRCDWWVNSEPEGEVCIRNRC